MKKQFFTPVILFVVLLFIFISGIMVAGSAARCYYPAGIWEGASDFIPPMDSTRGCSHFRLGGWGGSAADHTPRINNQPIDHVYIFIHGIARTASDWNEYRVFFKKQGYNDAALWALSYLGNGTTQDVFSTYPSNEENDLINFILAVKKYTGVSKFRLIGHSMGGTLIKSLFYNNMPAGITVEKAVLIATPNGSTTRGYPFGSIAICQSAKHRVLPFCSQYFGASPAAQEYRNKRKWVNCKGGVLVLYDGTTADAVFKDQYGDVRFAARDNVANRYGLVKYSHHPGQNHDRLRVMNISEVFRFIK